MHPENIKNNKKLLLYFDGINGTEIFGLFVMLQMLTRIFAEINLMEVEWKKCYTRSML